MSIDVFTGLEKTPIYYPPEKADVYYPETDGTEMGQNSIHFWFINTLAQMLELFFAWRKDVFVTGDIMLYYEEGEPKRFVAPDLMICFGVKNTPRRVYELWKEKVAPSIIFEIASESTWQKDISVKYALYERLGVSEYYVYDPERSYLPNPLMAYHLKNGEYEAVETKNNRVYSPLLNLELVDDGLTLKFFDHEKIEFLPTIQELAAKERIAQNKIEQLEKEIAELKKQNDGN
ncbi:MAG: Uma2 family endonuclease [Pyrinomonadaceae bacterium]|nr:Uma2 family endonuclease [Pyrinomonadaceae bacterium]